VGKRPLGRPMRRWRYSIRIGPREVGWEIVDWIQLSQGRNQWWALVNTVIYIRVSEKAEKFLTS